jgi:hypothetical protein
MKQDQVEVGLFDLSIAIEVPRYAGPGDFEMLAAGNGNTVVSGVWLN